MLTGGVAVVTDSAASIPAALAQRLGVLVVPVRVVIDHHTYAEGIDATGDRVLAAAANGQWVSTAEPTPAAMAAVYEECAAAGASAVVSVHVSRAFSRTVESAHAAATQSRIPVTVVDTGVIAMAEGFAALAAGARALYSADAQEVAQTARDVAGSACFIFTVDTLDFLRRGGRVSGLVHAIGTLLSIRPVMSIARGNVTVIDKVRSTGPARQRVREIVQERTLDMRRPASAVALVGGDPMEAGLGLDIAGPIFDAVPSASLVAHGGPGAYAAVVADMPDEFFLTL